MYITSKNAITEALVKNIIIAIYAAENRGKRENDIISLALSKNVRVQYLSKNEIEKMASQKVSMLAEVKENISSSLESVIASSLNKKTPPLFFILDGITDVHNFGAIIRNAYFFGLDAIITPKNGGAPLSEKVYEISEGSAYHIPIISVTNIVKSMETMKKNGFWIYYASENGETPLQEMKFNTPTAVILGNEHSGARTLVKGNADGSIRIETPTGFDSLNVSSASAVIAYAYSIYISK